MSKSIKPEVSYEDTFEKLDIRLGRVINVEIEESAPKKAYRIKADFGKFGVKTSVGRFTQHPIEELNGRRILGVLNFEGKKIGNTVSEFLMLGVQYPKADSGEATFITTIKEAKIGSKLF